MKRVIVAFGIAMMIPLSAYALSYSSFWGSPTEYDLQEMSEALEEAIDKINELEYEISSLKSTMYDLESSIGRVESRVSDLE
jgi:hypothetical protein